jgi:hypothetical protein
MMVRHEVWGRRGGLGAVTRRVASAGVTLRPSAGYEFGIVAAVFRARSGEPQYLSENDVDRRVLRLLSGAGRRARMQVTFPAAGGSARAALIVPEAPGRATRPQWTLDWTRRARRR